jgi:ionotropic glutamate receptor NMDA 1
MEELDRDWISNNTNCKSDHSFPSTLRLSNMDDVFMLVAGGVIMGIFIIFLEINYTVKKYRKREKLELSRKAFDRWRQIVEEVRHFIKF